jgi:hypothetical protein
VTAEPLFDDDAFRVSVAVQTAGARLRERQAARIANGCHPLSINGVAIPLHPDTPRTAYQGDPREYPTCGTCAWRTLLDHHNRTYPKCLLGWDGRRVSTAPRYSAGEASDVRAWWPGCDDWAPRTEAQP